ncbi:MAG: sigma-70 family RNA polymerase sigma factor [Planctomycetota bacterium]
MLIASAPDGDEDALGELLTVYRTYLVFLARDGIHKHMQAKVDPSDMVQEVCLVAHKGIRGLQADNLETFTAWLRGILVNTLAGQARHYLGTQKRDVRLERDIQQSVASASGFLDGRHIEADLTSPSEKLARNEAFLQLATALETLSEDHRRVVVLRHMDGLSFADVAQTMGRTFNSVEKLWVRALVKLKQVMGDR